MSIDRRVLLRGYGWLFVAGGSAFVLAPGAVVSSLNALGAGLGLGRLDESGRFWLALAGAMMAMVSRCAFSLARDPDQPAQWATLLLSKAVSTLLFSLFAALHGPALLLAGAAVDGPIFLHLLFLRGGDEAGPWPPRSAGAARPFHEVYFAKLNDPATRSALWTRFTVFKSPERTSTGFWCVLFDAPAKKVRTAYWEEERLPETGPIDPLWRLGPCSLGKGSMRAERGSRPGEEELAWDLSWKARSTDWGLIPPALSRLGIAKTRYRTAVAAGLFEGRVRMGEKHLWFSEAWGALGHVWGERLAEEWRWAHAVFPGTGTSEPAVFELLSARARLGPARTPRMTSACLLFQGRLHQSLGLAGVWRNRTREEEGGWSFCADFGGFAAEGFCRPDSEMTAELVYEDPAGGRRLCRNCGVSGLRLALRERSGVLLARFETPDGASVETVTRP